MHNGDTGRACSVAIHEPAAGGISHCRHPATSDAMSPIATSDGISSCLLIHFIWWSKKARARNSTCTQCVNEVGWASVFRRMSQSHRRQRYGCWGNRKACGAASARCMALAQSTNGGGRGGTAAGRVFEQNGTCKHAVSVEASTCPTPACHRMWRVWVTWTTPDYQQSFKDVIRT